MAWRGRREKKERKKKHEVGKNNDITKARGQEVTFA